MIKINTYRFWIICIACIGLLCCVNSVQAQTENLIEPPAVDTAFTKDLELNEEVKAAVTEATEDAENSGGDFENKRLENLWKEAEKQDAKYTVRKIADTTITNLKADKKLTYPDLQKKKEEIIPQNTEKIEEKFDPNKYKNAATILLFICIALVIVLILYAFFGKQYFAKEDKTVIEDATSFEDVEEFTEWQKALQAALAQKDYRLATRILFLETLQKMNGHNIIQYQKDKLNATYLQQLYGTRYYEGFTQIVRNFEYTWYGNYELTEEKFKIIQNQVQAFQAKIV